MTSVPILIGAAAGATGRVATNMTARSVVQPGLYAFRKT